MRQLKYVGLFFATGFVSGSIWLLAAIPSGSQPVVQLETNPPISQVIPDSEPTRLKLRVLNSNHQPLPDANVQVRLFTPPKTPWLTSDFPIVEGTTLLELNALAPAGELQFEQVLPIRGTYRMKVTVTPKVAEAFKPFEQALTFSVSENPVKYRNLAILAAVLLLAGFAGGWVIGGNQSVRPGEIAPQSVRLLLSGGIMVAIAALLWVNVSAELSSSHADHDSDNHASAPAVQQAQGIEVRLSGDTEAVVGRPAVQTIQVKDIKTGNSVSDVAFTIQAAAIEHHQHIFTYKGSPDATGRFTWQEQFFDGAPHQVVVYVEPLAGTARSFQPFQVAHQIDVEGIEPPLLTRLISLLYFTALFVGGLLAGLWLRRWQSRKQLQVSSSES
jgi:hypothetical protein